MAPHEAGPSVAEHSSVTAVAFPGTKAVVSLKFEGVEVVTQNELVTRLRTLGIRLTPQRLAIAEVVLNSDDHPSVKDIYQRVTEFFPYVTVATVYSTLALLEEVGIVRHLPFPGHARYDANLAPHANLVCLGCGTVVDAEVGQDMVAELRGAVERESDFQVSGQRVDIYGWCPGCAMERVPHRSQPVPS